MNKETAYHLVRETLESHFPEIKRKSIRISFSRGSDFYMAIQWIFFYYHLTIDHSALKFSDVAFKGCSGHELSHVLQMKQKGFVRNIISAFQKINSTTEEREADLLTVKKGLGHHLLQFHIEHNKKYKSYKKSEGLTRQEIKKLLHSQSSRS
ncbi:hypothetical protein [Elizabethkingia anophelis]|uniref:hypothetical protein n=1 Tax=Elizabethkingia anophelis TaxID=1117645 RepID=UPI00136966B9|nr:hypothetical protein [Elizabethkingia anophelis]MYY43932.1 hypothetical protein [Elizabethkingia anophelis]